MRRWRRQPGGAPATGGKKVELTAKDVAFRPTRLTARAGRITIEFDNRDRAVQHNLHLSDPDLNQKTSIEKGPIRQQLTVTLRLGTYRYICDVHPVQMRGELTVTG